MCGGAESARSLGVRTAGALGRIPVLDAFVERRIVWRRWGFHAAEADAAGSQVMCAVAYVDNLYANGPTPGCAMHIMEACAPAERGD